SRFEVVRMPDVVTKDLMKVYRAGKSEVIALRGLEMKMADKELVAVQGPSGCGKTTLLNLVGGIDRPTAGRVEIDGANIVDYSEGELVRYRRDQVGFVFQFFNLVPTLTAGENIELPMRLANKPASHRKTRTKQLLQLVDLENRAVHRPDELSGGEQQRIAIAVALSNDPSLILADEPTGELDTENGQRVLDLFEVLNKDMGKTVLIVTHDQRVSEITRRILQIEDGKIIGEVVPPSTS
ncbi:MAG: ABC transporter ATP-binding protein, partial [candidate division NC10 bacterium]